MSFDFFNSSNLAWGNKLSAAFNSLNNLADTALGNLVQVASDLEYYSQFLNRNYACPKPYRADMPARSNEIYDIVNGLVLTDIEYSGDELYVFITKYNDSTGKITEAWGGTKLREGYAFVIPAASNNNPEREIRFSQSNIKEPNEILLFQFRLDSNNKIYLVGDVSELKVNPCDCTQYRSMSKGGEIALPYEAQDYEAVCISTRYGAKGSITLNGQTIIKDDTTKNQEHAILYLKKGDKLNGSNISTAFKIKYNR